MTVGKVEDFVDRRRRKVNSRAARPPGPAHDLASESSESRNVHYDEERRNNRAADLMD